MSGCVQLLTFTFFRSNNHLCLLDVLIQHNASSHCLLNEVNVTQPVIAHMNSFNYLFLPDEMPMTVTCGGHTPVYKRRTKFSDPGFLWDRYPRLTKGVPVTHRTHNTTIIYRRRRQHHSAQVFYIPFTEQCDADC